MIEMRCPECDHLLRAGDRFAGKNVGCKYCGTVFAAPIPNAPNPPMPIRGESRFPKMRLGGLSIPPGPPPVPTPMPMVDDAPPAPDYASSQYPTPPVAPAKRRMNHVWLPVLAVLVLWAAAAGVVYWRIVNPIGSAKAQTPQEALNIFLRGLGNDDIGLMQSVSRYRNPEWTQVILRLMAENQGLERDFETQGVEPPVRIALPLGWSLPPSHEIQPSDFTLEENGGKATLAFHGRLTGYDGMRFVKQGIYWYVDLRNFEPMGYERDLARELAGRWLDIITKARNQVGNPQVTPRSVQQALFDTTHGGNGQATIPQLNAPPMPPRATTTEAEPLSPGDPLYKAVMRVVEAIHHGDQSKLQALVAPDGIVRFSSGAERNFWDVYTPAALAQLAQGDLPHINAIVPIDRGVSAVTLRVSTSTEQGGANTRYTFRKQDGYWLLARIAPESY